MALEITGLTIGAVALIGTFKDCIDVFGMIASARSLTDDAEILNTKLDVEKLLLLQWADRLRLTEPRNYDPRLDDPDLNRTVARVLESIKRLLSDGKTLRDRYGLDDYQEVRHNSIILDDRLHVGTTASSSRLQQFIERFNKLSLHNEVLRQEHSVATRFKWVIKDKEKFTGLMDELSYFVSRLNALVPTQEQSDSTMTEQDLEKIRSIPLLKVIVKATTGFQPQIAIKAQEAITFLNQSRVLGRLWFRTIDDRRTNIHERHLRTLNWALDSVETTPKWDNLAEWLRNGSGIYWLAGKAGSGKSTLMKYLSNHSQTTNLLEEWAAQSELVTLQFFFYALGRLEQKSQEGILRSLLFQFLDKHRDLIERVLPAMWKEVIISGDKDHDLAMPSISEMQTSFLHLVATVSADKRFWIMIDGLDEFQGKHATIATFLSRLERLPNVKVLVSSRPLPVLLSAFDHAPKMYLQDLTYRDIEAYINDTVLCHPHMAQLSHTESGKAIEIAEYLVKKASGVFLWVVLACQSIVEGLEEYDTIPELMNRATEIPPDLGDFFRQMIAGIDPRKRDQSARFLRLIFESQKSSAFDSIPTLGLAIVDEQGLWVDFKGPNVTELSNGGKVLLCKTLEGRLRSRCSGLVEIQAEGDIDFSTHFELITAEDAALVNSRVVFIHRSLFDFLCTERMWEWDTLRMDNEGGRFEPHVVLASLWTQLAGLQPWSKIGFSNVSVQNALTHNLCAGATNCPPRLMATNLSRIQCLLAKDGLYGRFWSTARLWLPHQSKCRKGYEDFSVGLALAAELGMADLVQFALEDSDELRRTLVLPEAGQMPDCSSFSNCPKRLYELNRAPTGIRNEAGSTIFPLLYHATCRRLLSALSPHRDITGRAVREMVISNVVVEYLLGKGHDPNEVFFTDEVGLSTTPWIEWLEFVKTDPWILENSDHSVELIHQRAAITLLLVDAGAELGAPGTARCNMVDESLSRYILDAAQRSGRTSVKLARSDDTWLKVRDTILSLRIAESHRNAHS